LAIDGVISTFLLSISLYFFTWASAVGAVAPVDFHTWYRCSR